MSLTTDDRPPTIFAFPGITDDTLDTGQDGAAEPESHVISQELINEFSEGTHHASTALPITGTPLPKRTDLAPGVTAVQTYLRTAGCAILADMQLEGMGAPVAFQNQNTIYAYLDEEIVANLITDVLIKDELIAPPLSDTDVDLIEAIMTVHHIAFTQQMGKLDVAPTEAADWPTYKGRVTESPTGLVFTTPHPLQELHNHSKLPERGVAMAGGIQHLTIDTPDAYHQTDIAFPYLMAYLTAHGITHQHANALLSNWYETTNECVMSVSREIRGTFAENGLPTEDPAFKYYLTDEAHTELTTHWRT